MKGNFGAIVKKLREEQNIKISDLADAIFVDPRHMSRIEKGEQAITVFTLMEIMQALGQPTEDAWVLLLEAEEFDEYRKYRQLRRSLRDGNYDEANDIVTQLESGNLSNKRFLQQFLEYAKIELNNELEPQQAVEEIYKALQITKPTFDECKVAEYYLNYNEIFLLISLTNYREKLGERDKAIAITKAMIENRERIRATEDDKAFLYPALMFNLSNYLGRAKRYKEALKYCNQAIEIGREYNNLIYVPNILLNMAKCIYCEKEEEIMYRPHLVRAYHCAYAIGERDFAAKIRKDAIEKLGISNFDSYIQ